MTHALDDREWVQRDMAVSGAHDGWGTLRVVKELLDKNEQFALFATEQLLITHDCGEQVTVVDRNVAISFFGSEAESFTDINGDDHSAYPVQLCDIERRLVPQLIEAARFLGDRRDAETSAEGVRNYAACTAIGHAVYALARIGVAP